MNFTEINVKPEYRSLNDNIVKEFYIPLLENAVTYKRAVGFFSSSALIEISKGITGLIKNGGKILLVASPRLSDEDIEAINTGFEMRNSIIEKALKNSFTEPKNIYEVKRLNLIANLIAEGRLDIKIAFTKNGMFHEKMGLIYDTEDNVVAFTGSMNETSTAFSHNYESIDVFCSWTVDKGRVLAKEKAFDAIWDDYEPNIDILDFSDVTKDMFEKYKTSNDIDLEIDFEEYGRDILDKELKEYRAKKKMPCIPEDVKLYDYQIEAIDSWQNSNFRGIFDMATGTGKTYTGLAAIVRLSEELNGNLAIIIVCPYQHLVEQWVEDIIKFSMNPIIAYSASKQKDWKKRLKDSIINFNIGLKENFSLVTTNATFASEYMQKEIKKIKGNVLLVVDEAHNFGADRLSRCLDENIQYRLALSATLERHNDEYGTKKLFDYFGEKNIDYPLERAIKEGKLTPYYYYPVVVHLTEYELEKYKELTKKIIRCCRFKSNGKVEISKSAEILLIERSRIIASASQKIAKLKDLMVRHIDDKHILVYCGAATINDSTYLENNTDEFEIRQIDAVVKMLGLELNMNVSKFTSEESVEEREMLKKEFSDGDKIQALVAIRCLDEGVNIPNIRTAFILASSTNPKEYIQRRGRVLRKAESKSKAVIYDFITLPRPISDAEYLEEEDLRMDISLVKRELLRMEDFAAIAENSSVADSIMSELREVYKLDFIGGMGYDI